MGENGARCEDLLPAGPAGLCAPRRHRRGDPRPPGGHRRRRDRVGEDHAAAQDLSRARSRGRPRRWGEADRAHPATPDRGPLGGGADRRGARHRARRRRRLPGPLHRPDVEGEPGQADDRRHPARRAPARPRPPQVRHAHHRRGPRAQPQHRLPPRLPQAPAPAPARPQGRHHQRDDRRQPLRRPLRRTCGRGVGSDVPGRGPLPPAPGAPGGRRGGRAGPARPDRGDRRRRARAVGRRPRRRARLPPRRARDPGHRRRLRRAARFEGGWEPPRDRPALLPPQRRRPAQGLLQPPVDGPPRRPRHQRRRDLADRPRHRVRRRRGRRADQPLLGTHQGAAAADRADQPGLGQPAFRSLRSRVRRHRDPALLRGGLRGATGVHRPGDPAHQPRQRHPADGLAAPRRHRPLPVRRAARPPQHQGRHRPAGGARRDHDRDRPATSCGRGKRAPRPDDVPAGRPQAPARRTPHRRRQAPGAAADRPAAGSDDPRGRTPRVRARRARHRRCPVDPGPARAAGGAAGAGRPAARPLQARVQRLPHLAQPLAPHQAAAEGAVVERVPADVQARAPQLHADPRVAGLRVAAAPGRQGDEVSRSVTPPTPPTRTASTRRCCPDC